MPRREPASEVPSASTDQPILNFPVIHAVKTRSLIRMDLLSVLAARPAGPAIVICAPAGYGKTTLLDSFSEAVATLSDGQERWTVSAGDSHHSAEVLERFLRRLRTYERQPNPGTFGYLAVIDNFHCLQTFPRAVLEDLNAWLRDKPDRCRVIFSGRPQNWPDLPFLRDIDARELTPITAADLAFTANDAQRFFSQSGRDISWEDAERLVKLSSGCPAALAAMPALPATDPLTDKLDVRDLVGELSTTQKPELTVKNIRAKLREVEKDLSKDILGSIFPRSRRLASDRKPMRERDKPPPSEEQEAQTSKLPPALFTEQGLQVYPLTAVASHVGLSPERILQLVKEGRIQGVKPATDWFVSLDDVEAYQRSPKRKPGPRPTPRLLTKRLRLD